MKNRFKSMILLAALSLGGLTAQTYDYPFRNPDLPLEVRVQDVISRLTLEEKVQLMKHAAPAVPRLGIPAYNWWNEALHGVARTKEKVTVFPQAIGMAATFDPEALQKMGDIASSEGRALFNEDLREGKTGDIYRGLTFTLSPEELSLVDEKGNQVELAGTVELYIGGGQPYLSSGNFGELKIEGERFVVY